MLAIHQKVVWATILCFLGEIWKKDYEMEFQIIITNGLAIRMSDIIHDGAWSAYYYRAVGMELE